MAESRLAPPCARKALFAGGRAAAAIATIKGQLANMRDGGFISRARLPPGHACIADVVCGGDVEAGSLGERGVPDDPGTQALLRACWTHPEDPGTHHGHAAPPASRVRN
jgi:hypothetical protein